MDFESDQIEKLQNILQACRVPQLLEDLDTKPIGSSDFKQYRRMANENIYLLLDILYQNRNLLIFQAYDNQITELRVNLMLVACEQLEPNPLFQSDDKLLLTSFRKIIFDHVESIEDVVYEKCIKFYKESITKDKWKTQIGAVHGFPLFCEILLRHKSKLINEDVIVFMLSVGSNLISHHDHHYKTIGAKIYRHLMELCDTQLVKSLNIHSVIFTEMLALIQRTSELDLNNHIFECLYFVIQIDGAQVKDTNWCKFDDVMSKLISQFSTESESTLCKMLLSKIVKYCTINKKKVEFNNLESFNEENFKNLRTTFNEPNYRLSRWMKKLMSMMTRESSKMLHNSNDAIYYLNSFHCIYIMTLFTIQPSIFQNQLDDFIKKFVLVLMQVVRTIKCQDLSNSVRYFLNTLKCHQPENEEFVKAMNKIQENL